MEDHPLKDEDPTAGTAGRHPSGGAESFSVPAAERGREAPPTGAAGRAQSATDSIQGATTGGAVELTAAAGTEQGKRETIAETKAGTQPHAEVKMNSHTWGEWFTGMMWSGKPGAEKTSRNSTQDDQRTTARTEKTDSVSDSFEIINPSWRIVLFGRRGAGKTSSGNTILGQEELRSAAPVCERRLGDVSGRLVSVVELPPLFNTGLSEEEVTRETHRCVSMSDPGVHAFLLVIPAGPLTDRDKGELDLILDMFSKRVTDYIIVLFTSLKKEPKDQFLKKNTDCQQLVQRCGGRYLVFSTRERGAQVSQLLQKIDSMVKENRPDCYTADMYLQAQVDRRVRRLQQELEEKTGDVSPGTAGKEEDRECVRMVLIGKTGSGKSATGNTILGRREFVSKVSTKSVTDVCQKVKGEVDGRPIAVIDTPGLFDTQLSNEEAEEEIAKCISLSAPGPHVFILVLQVGRFTKEERDTVELIKQIFGKRAEMYTIVIFTRGDDLENKNTEFFKGDRRIERLIHQCGGRYHVFDNKEMSNRTQVRELLEKIDSLVRENGGGFYTSQMFQEAEAAIRQEQERILREREEEMKAKHKEAMEEMKKRLEEERERFEKERKLREQLYKEREERLKREMGEIERREKETKREREEEDRKRREEEERQRREWETKLKETEEDRRRREREDQERRENEEKERREREQKDQEAEEKLRCLQEQMRKQQEQQEKKRERMEEQRERGYEERRKLIEELRSQRKDFERQMDEERQRKQQEEKARKEQKEEEFRREIEEMMRKYEEESRRAAEECNAWKKKYKDKCVIQ